MLTPAELRAWMQATFPASGARFVWGPFGLGAWLPKDHWLVTVHSADPELARVYVGGVN